MWTGWDKQAPRGNIATVDERPERADGAGSENNIDPMRLVPSKRDKFPKTLLGGAVDGGHLGDGFPLCSQLPQRHFLQAGAKYRYTGNASVHGALHDAVPTALDHLTPDPAASQLYAALCRAADNDGVLDGGRCSFPGVVTLPADLGCHGAAECGADMIHAVRIVDGAAVGFYVYVPAPCVRLQLFEGMRAANSWASVCADPGVASTNGALCCHDPTTQLADGPACPNSHPSYDARADRDDYGDVCRPLTAGDGVDPPNWWACPRGCAPTADARLPYCTLQSNASAVCKLGLGGVAGAAGAACLFVAEPLTYGTAAGRCGAEHAGGMLCPANVARELGNSDVDGR